MPDINTTPFRNIILETLPPVDRKATPLPGTDPNSFLASLTAVLTAGGWTGPSPTAATAATATASSVTGEILQTPTAAATPMPTFTSPLAPGASHAYVSNGPADIFSVLFGRSGADGQS